MAGAARTVAVVAVARMASEAVVGHSCNGGGGSCGGSKCGCGSSGKRSGSEFGSGYDGGGEGRGGGGGDGKGPAGTNPNTRQNLVLSLPLSYHFQHNATNARDISMQMDWRICNISHNKSLGA